MLQFGASLTDDASNVNYDYNMFIIQATATFSTKNKAIVSDKHSRLLLVVVNYRQKKL
jgi:hypothetical protein